MSAERTGLLTNRVFSLEYLREYDDRENTELWIGVFDNEAEALATASQLKEKPGFRDYPEGFEVYPLVLGRIGWPEGFITRIGPPPKDAAGEAFDLPAWIEAGEEDRKLDPGSRPGRRGS